MMKIWHGFAAVQAMDFTAGVLTIFGVEGTRIVDGAPLFHIPWSHSLVGALVIAFVAGLIFKAFKPLAGKRGFCVVAILAFSHWPLDLLVHRPDLTLYPGAGHAMGFALWDFAWPTYWLEVVILGSALAWWLRVSTGPRWTVVVTLLLFMVMSALQFIAITLPTLQVQGGTFDPASQPHGPVAGIIMVATLAVVTALIAWIEKYRPSKFTSVS